MTADVSRLLRADRPEAALAVWQSINRPSENRQTNLKPGAGQVLNAISSANPLGDLGFNWSINRTPGIHVRWIPQRQAADFSFDGSEPEVSTLLFQPVVLTARTSYQLNCRIQSEDSYESAFSWRLVELNTGKTLENEPGNDTIRQDGSLSWTFLAPASHQNAGAGIYLHSPGG